VVAYAYAKPFKPKVTKSIAFLEFLLHICIWWKDLIKIMEGSLKLPKISKHRALKSLWRKKCSEILAHIIQTFVIGINGTSLTPN